MVPWNSGGFPTVCVHNNVFRDSERSKHSSMLSRLFSAPLFVFPLPFFPASMHRVYDSTHKHVVQVRATGSHLMHGAVRISFQSRYSHNQTCHFHQQVRVTEQNWWTKNGSWGVGVWVFFFFPTDDRWQLLSHSLVPCFSLSLSLSLFLLSNPTFGELNEIDRVCNNQPIWRSINISEAISLMWAESITVW